MSYYVGQELRMPPNVHVDRLGHLMLEKDCPCKIVYINRPHRFFTVEFEFFGRKFRESFKYSEEKDLACNVKGGALSEWLR